MFLFLFFHYTMKKQQFSVWNSFFSLVCLLPILIPFTILIKACYFNYAMSTSPFMDLSLERKIEVIWSAKKMCINESLIFIILLEYNMWPHSLFNDVCVCFYDWNWQDIFSYLSFVLHSNQFFNEFLKWTSNWFFEKKRKTFRFCVWDESSSFINCGQWKREKELWNKKIQNLYEFLWVSINIQTKNIKH